MPPLVNTGRVKFCTQEKYLGRPASRANSASIMAAPGSFSEGLRTNVLPTVQAIGNIQSGIMAGKLKGQMPATTCTMHSSVSPLSTHTYVTEKTDSVSCRQQIQLVNHPKWLSNAISVHSSGHILDVVTHQVWSQVACILDNLCRKASSKPSA
jgi:hypothetical protein